MSFYLFNRRNSQCLQLSPPQRPLSYFYFLYLSRGAKERIEAGTGERKNIRCAENTRAPPFFLFHSSPFSPRFLPFSDFSQLKGTSAEERVLEM